MGVQWLAEATHITTTGILAVPADHPHAQIRCGSVCLPRFSRSDRDSGSAVLPAIHSQLFPLALVPHDAEPSCGACGLHLLSGLHTLPVLNCTNLTVAALHLSLRKATTLQKIQLCCSPCVVLHSSLLPGELINSLIWCLYDKVLQCVIASAM